MRETTYVCGRCGALNTARSVILRNESPHCWLCGVHLPWAISKPVMCEASVRVIPDTSQKEYWLGYCLGEGEHLRLMQIGTEAEVDALMDEYKLTGCMTLPLRIRPGMYEVAPVLYAVKLQASEALKSSPTIKVNCCDKPDPQTFHSDMIQGTYCMHCGRVYE